MIKFSRIALVACLLSLVALGGSSMADDASVAEGKPPVALTVSNWTNSKELKLADLKGKVVVLKFWATWCPVCKGELPKFQKLSNEFKDKAVFIAIHVQKDHEKMDAFLKRNKFTFPAAEDDTAATAKAYGAKELPFSVIIDKKGNVKKLDAKLEEDEIKKLVAE